MYGSMVLEFRGTMLFIFDAMVTSQEILASQCCRSLEWLAGTPVTYVLIPEIKTDPPIVEVKLFRLVTSHKFFLDQWLLSR